MIQGFGPQLISSDVGSELNQSGRQEIPDLSLDQNYNNQNSINYVNVSVPTDISINRNFYSTVSLPQNIVDTIDQGPESLSSVYVHPSDHLLDKNMPLTQSFNTGVGGILSIEPVVSNGNEGGIAITDATQISLEGIDRSQILRSLKLSFVSRAYESISLSEIPVFLEEYSELRRVYYVLTVYSSIENNTKKNMSFSTEDPPEDVVDPLISQIPDFIHDYKTMSQSLKKCHICPTCGKSFSSRFSLTTHMTIHSSIKAFECPHTGCSKCFRTKSALNTHIGYAHTEIKQNVCRTCGKAFAKVWLLRQHEIRHVANHRFSCNKCNQTFAYEHELKKHELTIHSGIKPYICTFDGCGKGFNSKNTLRLHMKTHTETFECPFCYKTFRYKCDMKRHQKKAH